MATASRKAPARSENVIFRSTPGEQRLEAAARAAGARSLSAWIRGLLLREAARLARRTARQSKAAQLARFRDRLLGVVVRDQLQEVAG